MARNKDINYFKAFIELSDYSLKAAEFVQDYLKNFDPNKFGTKVQELHEIEHAADLAKHNLMNHLMKEFLPPIEREDIISLADKIDDVTDAIEDALMRMYMYHVTELHRDIMQFADLIVLCCKALHDLLHEFQNFKKSSRLYECIIEINKLEEDGDALYTKTVRKLYKTSSRPIELMVWTEIIDRFEKCFDACEAAADDINAIVMKNS